MRNKIAQIMVLSLPLISIISAQPNFPDDPAQAPIGGLGLLAAAGGAMALKKLYDKHKK
jgi:4-hydroxybenzoate polyprenyltransferase